MRKPRRRNVTTLSPLVREAALEDKGAAMAIFLLDNTGSIFGRWVGYMTADDQRTVFGRKIGKGMIEVDGEKELVALNVSVCFGTMRDTVWSSRWIELVDADNAKRRAA